MNVIHERYANRKRELEAKEIRRIMSLRRKSSDDYTKFEKDDDYQGFVLQTDATLNARSVCMKRIWTQPTSHSQEVDIMLTEDILCHIGAQCQDIQG